MSKRNSLAIITFSFLTLLYLVFPSRFATTSYFYIPLDDMKNELDPIPLKDVSEDSLCPIESGEPVKVDLDETVEVPNISRNLLPGGVYKTSSCRSQFDVAIVICYRNRTSQLNMFLRHMHPYLQRQNLDYRIIVVEQTFSMPFNRAKLFNVGFTEALKLHPYPCFIFHDVDLLPQHSGNVYACTKQPRHMSSCLDTFRYNLPYKDLFGGAIAISSKQFEMINGYNNDFYGWGGEDDDFYNRIEKYGLRVERFHPDVSKYTMIAHNKETPSPERFQRLKEGLASMKVNGLNSLKYTVLSTQLKPLYTHILVDL